MSAISEAILKRSFKLCIIVAMVALAADVQGQKGYKKGSIRVNDEVILDGKVYPLKTNRSVTAVVYLDRVGFKTKFIPANIEEFSITGKNRFVSGNLVDKEAEGKFVEVLFKGSTELHTYEEGESLFYFITAPDGRVFKIKLDKSVNVNSFNKYNPDFGPAKAVLAACLTGVPEIRPEIEKVVPSRESLVTLLQDYELFLHGSDSEISFKMYPPAFKAFLSFYGGYTADDFTVNPHGDIYSYKVDPSVYPVAGIMLDACFPKLYDKLVMSMTLSAANRYIYGYSSANSVYFGELHIHQTILRSDMMFGVSLGKGRTMPIIKAGPAMEYKLKENSRIDTDIIADSSVYSESYPYTQAVKFRAGITAGAGLVYRINSKIALSFTGKYSYLSGDQSFTAVNSLTAIAGITF